MTSLVSSAIDILFIVGSIGAVIASAYQAFRVARNLKVKEHNSQLLPYVSPVAKKKGDFHLVRDDLTSDDLETIVSYMFVDNHKVKSEVVQNGPREHYTDRRLIVAMKARVTFFTAGNTSSFIDLVPSGSISFFYRVERTRPKWKYRVLEASSFRTNADLQFARTDFANEGV